MDISALLEHTVSVEEDAGGASVFVGHFEMVRLICNANRAVRRMRDEVGAKKKEERNSALGFHRSSPRVLAP